jgi:phosphoglucosamine mutase
MGRLFGTDGVRGEYGRDLTDELAFELGRAAVVVLARHDRHRETLVIGRDTRASGERLERALAEGIRAAGADVILAGVQPTPAVAFLTTDLGMGAGVVISASHNPPGDNGIKFFGPLGYKLSDELEDEIEAEMRRGVDEAPTGAFEEGRVLPMPDGVRHYLDHVAEAAEAPLTGMRIVVDCANGAACVFAPEVLRRLGATVHSIHDAPDGTNINVGCGALHPEVVAEAVMRSGADVGIAHDGDADRALFADAHGNVIDGDHVLAVCALTLKEEERLLGDTVVTTAMANLGFHKAMEAAGIEVVVAKVGDRYVLEEMLARGAVLGGEQSGHVIFADHATTGDGILTAVKFLSIACRTGRSVADLASVMVTFPQVLENVAVAHKERLDEAAELWDAVRAVEAELGGSGRVLVRASGTEPLVRVMVEAESAQDARRHASALVGCVRSLLG